MPLARIGCFIGSRVGPFVYPRLCEVLSLALCLRPVGSGEKMAKIEPLADFSDEFRSVASSVIGHDLIDGDLRFLEVPGRPLQKSRRRFIPHLLQRICNLTKYYRLGYMHLSTEDIKIRDWPNRMH